jgi:hypothetical protein
MKAMMICAAAMMMFAASEATAQENNSRGYFSNAVSYQNARIPAALKGFERCLGSENDGVVESAMAHLAKMKLELPRFESEQITRRLEALATRAETAGIRYKAYLASQVFKSPELFEGVRQAEYQSADEFFGALASRLQSSTLTYNEN